MTVKQHAIVWSDAWQENMPRLHMSCESQRLLSDLSTRQARLMLYLLELGHASDHAPQSTLDI